MKTVTINVTGASQNQWSTFLLELNLMKKAWRSYGVSAELKAKSLNKIITQGTSIGEKKVKRKKNHITKIFWMKFLLCGTKPKILNIRINGIN